MRAPLPRFVVLGGTLPDVAREALSPVVDLATDEASADGALVGADAPEALRRYREAGGRLPVFAVDDGPVGIAERLAWVRHGADDLLGATGVGDALARKLRADTWRARSGLDPAQTAARVDRWLRASSRYLEAREALVAELGGNGRGRFLDASFLRDQVLRTGEVDGAAPDPLGQRRVADREILDWPVRVLAPVPSGGHLQNIGPDGACLALPGAPGPGERLQVEIEGEQVAARLELEVRWQRRVARGRWQVGAFSIACAIARG